MQIPILVYLVAIAYVWHRGTIFLDVRNWRARDEIDAELWWYRQGGDSAEDYWRFRATRVQRLARVWRQFANCPLCSGYWIGVFGFSAWHYVPWFVEMVGIGALVGTLALAVCGGIRRL